MTTVDDSTELWETIFPYGSPYPGQQQAITEMVDTLQDNGVYLFEGDCGTGKTLASLCAALQVTQHKTTNVLVTTSTKSQYEAWESDLKEIDMEVTSTTLGAKADVSALAAAEHPAVEEHGIDALREPLTNGHVEPVAVVQAATGNGDRIGGDGWESPYTEVPEINDDQPVDPFYAKVLHEREKERDAGELESGSEYAFERPGGEMLAPILPLAYKDETVGVVDRDRVIRDAASEGLSPHTVAYDLAQVADVVITNYTHLFMPGVSGHIQAKAGIDDSVVLCDEAHNLTDRVLDGLGRSIPFTRLERSIKALTELLDMTYSSPNVRINDERVVSGGQSVLKSEVRGLRDLQVAIYEKGIQEATHGAANEAEEQIKYGNEGSYPPDVEHGLREPDSVGDTDRLTAYLDDQDLTETTEDATRVAKVVLEAGDALDKSHAIDHEAVASVTGAFDAWRQCGSLRWYREIELEPRDPDYQPEGANARMVAQSANSMINGRGEVEVPDGVTDIDDDADDTHYRDKTIGEFYRGSLKLRCTLPDKAIARVFDQFQGLVFLSATLYPLDQFKATTGIKHLDDDRPRNSGEFPLHFPEENRCSVTVRSDSFFRSARGTPGNYRSEAAFETENPEQAEVRGRYLRGIETVINTTPGNVLVCAPNYGEAEWFANKIDAFVDRDVLLHQSSHDDEEIEEIKERFFAGGSDEPRVLCTSAQGKLSEGVDYDGEKLDAAVAFGVPLPYTGGPYKRAVQATYRAAEPINGSAYEQAFGIPSIRKTRQAIGRVVRGEEDVGARVLMDERYSPAHWSNKHRKAEIFPDREIKGEFGDGVDSMEMLGMGLSHFWDKHRPGNEASGSESGRDLLAWIGRDGDPADTVGKVRRL